MNAHANLNVLSELVRDNLASGNVNVGERRANSRRVVGYLAGDSADILEARSAQQRSVRANLQSMTGEICIPLSSGGGSNLLHQHGAGKSSPADSATSLAADADIVTDNQLLNLDALSAGLFHGHAEVQDVASVVHDDDEDAAVGVLGAQDLERTKDLLGGWGRKDGAGDGCGQKAAANETCKGRLVAGATAGEQRNGML